MENQQQEFNIIGYTGDQFAKAMYQAYGQSTNFKNYQGNPMPQWEDLPEGVKAAWMASSEFAKQQSFKAADSLGATYKLSGFMDEQTAINKMIKMTDIGGNFKTDNVSDGYHTFGELYNHRITLWICVCRIIAHAPFHHSGNPVWKSRRHSDGELAFGGDWFVLGIGEEAGKQMTYHLPIDRWDEAWFAYEKEAAPEWDGHTSDQVLERIKELG